MNNAAYDAIRSENADYKGAFVADRWLVDILREQR